LVSKKGGEKSKKKGRFLAVKKNRGGKRRKGRNREKTQTYRKEGVKEKNSNKRIPETKKRGLKGLIKVEGKGPRKRGRKGKCQKNKWGGEEKTGTLGGGRRR